jgi:hypothetical protein
MTVRVRTTCPLLPPGVERRHRPHPIIDQAGGRSSVWGKAAYAGGFTRAIEIKDHPGVSLAIHQVPGLLLPRIIGERATLEIIEKERAQRFNGGLGKLR